MQLFLMEESTSVSKTEYDLIIIGGGPAGLTAAMYGARYKLDTAVLEKETPGGQVTLTDFVENYPGFPEGIEASQLAKLFEEHAKVAGAEIISRQVSKLVKHGEKDFELFTYHGDSFRAKSVIIATGCNPRRLGVPGEKELTGRGVSYCAVCDGPFFKGRPIAVVGGGESALTEALYLAKLTDKLYLIHRRDQFRGARVLGDRVRNHPNIELVLNSVVTEIHGKDKVEGVTVKNKLTGETGRLDVDAVFIYIGLIPNIEPFKDLVETDEAGFIKTDERMRTSTDGLFAAGDVRSKNLRQIVTAVADGALAATSADEYINS